MAMYLRRYEVREVYINWRGALKERMLSRKGTEDEAIKFAQAARRLAPERNIFVVSVLISNIGDALI